MKTFKLIVLVITIAATNIAFGQDNTEDMMFGQSNVSKKKKEKSMSTSMDRYIYDVGTDDKLIIKPKQITEDFTSYTIRIKVSSEGALSPDHKIFKEFGKLIVDQGSNGDFIYLIGAFKKESLANEYLQKIVSPRYPMANVVQYENGQAVPLNGKKKKKRN